MEAAYPKLYNARYSGVLALNADVTMNGCTVKDIRPTDEYVGVQNGNAIYAVSETAKTLTLNNVVVDNFQKTGDLTRANVTLNVTGGSITGLGETTLTAQNGIQYSGPATIKGMTISGIYYTPESAGAVALFAYPMNNDASTIDGVTVKGCEIAVSVYSPGTVTVTNSVLEGAKNVADGATLTIDGVQQ